MASIRSKPLNKGTGWVQAKYPNKFVVEYAYLSSFPDWMEMVLTLRSH